ncbi:MAG: DNA polymerase III subunit beta [Treponema sp.]|nr:DNA polymerase III subunit beta [Treponema sp.]
MKFQFDRDAMIKEVAIAQEIIANKSPISILSNVLLIAENNTLTIKASDSTVDYITKIPVEIQEEGSTTIFCDKFMKIITKAPQGQIEFEQSDITVTIRPLKGRFTLKSIAVDKFPEINSLEGSSYFELPAKELKEMIQQTSFAVSEDGNRHFMMGVHFEKQNDNLIMVATDGRRLSYAEKNLAQGIPDFPAAIVPTKILDCVLKHASDEGNVSLAVIDKKIFFKFGNYEFSSLLLEGEFPNYRRVIPSDLDKSFQVQKSDLLEALDRIGIYVDKNSLRTIFKLTPGKLTILSPELDLGSADEEIPCEYNGEEIMLAFNFRFVEEPLKLTSAERIAFEFKDANKAAILRTEPKSDYFHVIMTMNLN